MIDIKGLTEAFSRKKTYYKIKTEKLNNCVRYSLLEDSLPVFLIFISPRQRQYVARGIMFSGCLILMNPVSQ